MDFRYPITQFYGFSKWILGIQFLNFSYLKSRAFRVKFTITLFYERREESHDVS